jgi:hypothetical protein
VIKTIFLFLQEGSFDLGVMLNQEETVNAIKGQFSLAWQSLKHVNNNTLPIF